MCKIKIIDAIMGAGKTSWAIQKMNTDKVNNYIYITPFLTEVSRIKEKCKSRKFYEPINFGEGKLDNLHKLLLENKNITSTHALFRMSTDITRELIRSNDYILILDEVMDVIEQLGLKKDDLPTILNSKFAHIEDNVLIWDKEDYDGEYNYIKIMAMNKSLIVVNNTLLMWNFPVDVFKSFKEVYILTYMFHSQIQRYYYDLYKIEYEYCGVKIIDNKYELVDKCESNNNKDVFRTNINILDDNINKIGDNEFALSSTWFKQLKNKDLIKQLQKNTYNFFKQKVKSKSKDNMWTTFKSSKSKLLGKGYTKGFIPVNARATNDYADKINLAYCANIFLNPIIKQYFIDKDVIIDEEGFALSELLQWIFRSAIRNKEEIYVYIPSSRMRLLLINWLKQ